MTAPVPGNYTAYKFVAQLKDMMTAADSKEGSTELEECVSQDPAAGTTSIQKGCAKAKATGVYVAQGSFSRPSKLTHNRSIAATWNTEKSHFAANGENCYHMGEPEPF
jgi:hypothetical protein